MPVLVRGEGLDETWVPTEEDLPYSDGIPMESERHVLQAQLLRDALRHHWRDRDDVYIGGNQFVYYSTEKELQRDFRGPDFFVALGVARRERKSWVTWIEGKGPDLVIELLSASTALVDQGEKKQIYQDLVRVPEYFWFDPFSADWAGFVLHDGRYQPIEPDADGRLPSRFLELSLVRWEGLHQGIAARWLRWAAPDGSLLPTPDEELTAEATRAAEATERAIVAEQRADRLAARLRALGVDPESAE